MTTMKIVIVVRTEDEAQHNVRENSNTRDEFTENAS